MCNSIYADSIIVEDNSIYLHIGEEGRDVCKHQLMDIIRADSSTQNIVFSCNGVRINDVAYLAKSVKMNFPDMTTKAIIEDNAFQMDTNTPNQLMWFDKVLFPQQECGKYIEMTVKKANKDACDIIIQP